MRHRNYCDRDSGMNQRDDFRPDALVSDGRTGVGLGLLLDCLGFGQEYDCCGKTTEPDSAADRFGAGHLWLDAESGEP